MKTKTRCALVIGHSDYARGASNSTYGIDEFSFNSSLATKIVNMLKQNDNIDIIKIFRDPTPNGYQELPDKINMTDPDFIISLHCNAFNKKASGTEVLYYHTSSSGKVLANILLSKLTSCLRLKNRGIKPKTAEDRGGYILKYTKAPCVIAEPFFIDNNKDLKKALFCMNTNECLVSAYTEAIVRMSEQLKR